MPYLHKGSCGGEIKWRPPFPIPPKCLKCGKTWPVSVIYGLPPDDMKFVLPTPRIGGMTKEDVVKKLPKWPRWVRITVVSLLLLVAASVILKWC